MKTCKITGKNSKVAGGYSNRTRATKFNPTGKKRRKANLQKKTFVDPQTGQKTKMVVSTKGLKEIKKNGIAKTLAKLQ